jgi:hypothetical protein
MLRGNPEVLAGRDQSPSIPICVGYDHKYGTISVFVRNLFDERYLTGISPGYGEAAIGDRRMIGIRATGRL